MGGRTSRSPERIAQGLLREGWDDEVYGTDELGDRLRAAVREVTSADTELWEHSTRGKTVWSMGRPDLLSDAAAPDSELRGMDEEVERILARLSPAERKVADCYAADNLTALHTGQQPAMEVRVRRKLKRLGQETRRRQRLASRDRHG
ncbi:hypothetical protein ACWCQK_38125 [Streptomyces sp. NPDC002306]